MRASGEYLAKRLQCEAALVTAGAASALTLGTAACITRGNADAIVNIPVDMTGLKNEVIVQKAHRYEYDHALRNCGIRFVEVETLRGVRRGVQRADRDGALLQRRRGRPDQPRGLGPRGASAWRALLQRRLGGRSSHCESVELHQDGLRPGDVLGWKRNSRPAVYAACCWEGRT